MQTRPADVLTPRDLISLAALADYVARQKGFPRENAYYRLETEFNVPDIQHILRDDFDRAMSFLVDLENISGLH